MTTFGWVVGSGDDCLATEQGHRWELRFLQPENGTEVLDLTLLNFGVSWLGNR